MLSPLPDLEELEGYEDAPDIGLLLNTNKEFCW